jgi:membrane-associated phospholipid phosphatase
MVHYLKQRWGKIKLFEQAVIYLFVCLTILLVVFKQRIENQPLFIIFNMIMILLIIFISPFIDDRKNKLLHFIRYWYLVIAIPFIYWYIGNFIHLIFADLFDRYIISFETALFGEHPNIWIQKMVSPLLTEIMQISYATYWFIIPIGAAIFYFHRQYKKLELVLFYTFTTFFISYLLFIFLPVAGPRIIMADRLSVPYKGILLTPILRNFIADVGLKGGAFPSSHVAVALVILIFIWKYYPATAKKYILPIVSTLSLATIYGQYHYVTDVIAGLFLGLLFGTIGIKHAELILSREKSPQSAKNFTTPHRE